MTGNRYVSAISEALATEKVLERTPEVDVEDGVNNGIECRVDVAQPDNEVNGTGAGVLFAVFAKGEDDVHEKEGQPTGDERPHNDGHSSCSAPLF